MIDDRRRTQRVDRGLDLPVERTRPRYTSPTAIAPARAEVDSSCMITDDFSPAFTRLTLVLFDAVWSA